MSRPLTEDQLAALTKELLIRESFISVIETRKLSGKDISDIVAIKTDAHLYEGLYGLITVNITSIEWICDTPLNVNSGILDIRAAQYNEWNDVPIIDNMNLTSTRGTIPTSVNYCFAVNDGEVGPAAIVNQDGTWDLLYIVHTLPINNTLPPIFVRVKYSVSFNNMG